MLRDSLKKEYRTFEKAEAEGKNVLPKLNCEKTMAFMNRALGRFGGAGSELHLQDFEEWFNELADQELIGDNLTEK